MAIKQTTKAAAMDIQPQPVLVITSNREVYFGYTVDPGGPRMELANARMCIYWASDIRGVLGLAAIGPNDQCRIGHKVDWLTVLSVITVASVTAAAAKKWEGAPWR